MYNRSGFNGPLRKMDLKNVVILFVFSAANVKFILLTSDYGILSQRNNGYSSKHGIIPAFSILHVAKIFDTKLSYCVVRFVRPSIREDDPD